MSDENKPGVGAYVKDQDANAAISDIPKNRAMIVAKLSGAPALGPMVVEDLTNPEEVFDHFKPNVDVAFEDESGAEVKENLRFKNLGDFGKKGITKQSNFLQNMDSQKENYIKFLKQLKSNKTLQSILADEEAKAAYIESLKSLLTELQATKQDA